MLLPHTSWDRKPPTKASPERWGQQQQQQHEQQQQQQGVSSEHSTGKLFGAKQTTKNMCMMLAGARRNAEQQQHA